MNSRILLYTILVIVIFYPKAIWAQATLDDIRLDILKESREEIQSISDEIKRQKRSLAEKKEKEEKKSAYQEKILRAQRIESIEKQYKLLNQSNELLEAIEERTEFKSEKRWRYEELLKIYAEKPIEQLPIEEQEQTANKMLAQATTRLIELLKIQATEKAKKQRGEEYEDITVSEDFLVELKQYTQLVKRIELSKVIQPEVIEKKKEAVIKSTKELIALLKEEAIRRAEIKALAKEEIEEPKLLLKNFEGSIGIHYSYDDNANADTAFEGGQFVRNYFAFSWLPSLNEYLEAELGTWYLTDNYTEDSDLTFKMAAGQTSLKWHPMGNETLTFQPGFEWTDTHYPDNESVSTKENKLFFDTKHKFWEKWSQELNFEEIWLSYDNNRLSRDGDGNRQQNSSLEKRRYSVEYILGFPFIYKTSFKLKQKGRRQTSNDAFTDFYDYYTYKVTGELGRSLTKKLYAKAALSYEQKDYSTRTVTDHQVAQEDRTYKQKVTFFYFLDADWLINYTWARTKVDSNSTVYDYEKMAHLIGAYYSF